MNRDMQKAQALKCIETLTRTFSLSSDITKACLSNEILYSFALNHQNRRWAVCCPIESYEEFSKVVFGFEEKFGAYVYHCLLNGDMLTMLYVGQNKDDWNHLSPLPGEDIIYAAVYNTKNNILDFGYVQLDRLSKTLIRIT